MKWGDWFLLAMSLGYVCAAVAYWLEGHRGLSVALLMYSLANLGLIYESSR